MLNHTEILIHWVNRLGFLTRSELSQRFRAHGHKISAEDWALLLVLWSKGAQAPSDLAAVTLKDRTTVTRLVDAMARKGLVTRREDPNDRRRSQIDVTEHGAALRTELIPIAEQMLSEMLAEISPEDLETTTRTLKRITEAFAENLSR